MRKVTPKIQPVLGALFVSMLAFAALARAASISAGPVSVFAEIPSGLVMELTIIDQLTGATVPSMDFGELSQVDDEYRATRFFNVLLKISTAGNSYELTQLSTPLTRSGGTETIPNGAFFVKPFYEEADNAGFAFPSGASLGPAGTAVATQAVFKDPTGSGRTVRLQYTLTGDPATGATQNIPFGQKSGSYAATVQFTLTTT
jgi:hypothetical protein